MKKVVLKNSGKTLEIEEGTKIKDLIKTTGYVSDLPVLAARVDNRIRELNSIIYNDSEIEFIDLTFSDGMRMVQRGLIFVLYLASKELFPDRKLKVLHSLNNGLFCELGPWVSQCEILSIKERMKEIIDLDLPFCKEKMDKRMGELCLIPKH